MRLEQLESFWKSIYSDLSDEDLAGLIDDWTAHGVMIIENIDGMPFRALPEQCLDSKLGVDDYAK